MKMIEAERGLLQMMRGEARRRLGDEASATDVETLAQELYEGPKRVVNDPETPLQRHRRERAIESTRADIKRYGR